MLLPRGGAACGSNAAAGRGTDHHRLVRHPALRLVARLPRPRDAGRAGRYRVLLRGKPALDQLPQFHATVAANPDLDFGGPYRNPEDLADIYGQVHLSWLIDRYDAGKNSDWLLPNRLYEGCRHHAVPVALAGTEVANFLGDYGLGLTIAAPDARRSGGASARSLSQRSRR